MLPTDTQTRRSRPAPTGRLTSKTFKGQLNALNLSHPRAQCHCTSEHGWMNAAIESLLNYDDIVILDAVTDQSVFVSAGWCEGVPVWRVIRRELREHGIKVPARPGADQ